MPRTDEPYEPPWGREGWPRSVEGGLDEADRLLVDSLLRLTPLERLERLRDFEAGLDRLRDAKRVRSD